MRAPLAALIVLAALVAPGGAQAVDLNCNGIEEEVEPLVDLADELCLATTDDDGVPWPNSDYYLQYEDFGCLYPLLPDNDYDGDGFGSGML